MFEVILFSLLAGALWGFLWGGLDAVFLLKGFLASPEPLPSIFRSFIAMLLASFATSVLLGTTGGLVGIVVALVVSFKARPWVMARWRW